VDTLLAERQAKFLAMGVFQEKEQARKGLLQRIREFF
jgi:hypothetical protein